MISGAVFPVAVSQVHATLARADVADAREQLVEVVGDAGAGWVREALVVHHEALDQVLAEAIGGPLAELCSTGRANAVSDGEDGVEVIVSDAVGFAVESSCQITLNNCSLIELGGFLSIREGLSFGETHTPKTGKREIPIARALAALLGEVEKGARDGHVAVTADGEAWGQYGLDQAFERVRDRAGLSGWSVYALRHYAITSWLRRGIPVHVVQKMAGHRNLATTQHYVHFLKADLEDAARRLDDAQGNGRGNSLVGFREPRSVARA